MASSLGLEFEADFTMDLFSELAPISRLQLSENEEDNAMGFTAETVSTTTQPGSPSKIEIKNMSIAPLTLDLATALATPGLGQREAEDTTTSIIEESDIPNASATGASIEYALTADLEQETGSVLEEEPGPHVLIDVTEQTGINMKVMVIVSMVAPFADSANTLIHAGDFLLEVTPTTTIREIKHGITNTLEICYEDMALVFVGKFLIDSRTVEYYFIDDGQTLHLLVESPNKLFKDVFEAFKRLGLSEEKAWFATRSFIHVMRDKYSVDGFGNEDTPALTEELLLHELEQLYVPDSDESDDSSADDDDPEVNDANVIVVGGVELEFSDDETDEDDDDEDSDLEEDHGSEEEEENSEDEDQDSDNDEVSDINENEDASDYFTSHALAPYTPVALFEWN